MAKFDYKKELKELYSPKAGIFSFVEVPTLNFLMIDGHGNPNTSLQYQEAIEALYSVSYGLKFALKPSGLEYSVPPLEGLWWAKNMADFSQASNKDEWDWTAMIMQHEGITAGMVEKACAEAARKKSLPGLSRLRFEPFAEGLSVQILYFGAYADEGPTIARMHAFIAENGYSRSGKHHEIYIGDPRRNPPEKLKTIIRQPVSRQV